MNGQRALIYSRIRENRLDPSDTDISRGTRQQAVADALGHRIASVGTFPDRVPVRQVTGRLVHRQELAPPSRGVRQWSGF